MNDFSDRATALLPRIEADHAGPDVRAELEQLRSLWRSMSAAERAESAIAARALATAQGGSRAHAASPLRSTEEDEARRALSGLDRIEVAGAAERAYDGPLDPEALLSYFGLGEFRPGQRDAVVGGGGGGAAPGGY